MKKYYLAIDIGASSGRHIVGWEEDGAIKTDEVFRFPNGTRVQCGHLVWDIVGLFKNVNKGIRRAFAKYPQIESLAIDTWGVDYVLMTKDGALMRCLAYRDSRTNSVIDEVHSIIPFKELYSKTGIQFQPFNTIYQLYEETKRNRLSIATDFLMIPEYLNYLLTGIKKKEYTNATTTGLVNAETGEFDKSIISVLGLPERLFGKLYVPGTSVGALKPEIAAEVGGQTAVVLCATHDTASAVAAVPAPRQGNWAYISAGTWALLGAELDRPLVNEAASQNSFTNEGGLNGKIRFLTNIMGSWLFQETRRVWSEQKGKISFAEMEKLALNAEPCRFLINPNDSSFVTPGDMPQRISDFCESSGQGKISDDGAVVRAIYDSLALYFRCKLETLEELLGVKYACLNVVGGGTKDGLLMQLASDALNIPVVAGPVEATAIGNLLAQAITHGDLADLAAARQVVKDSFEVKTYQPNPAMHALYNGEIDRFRALAK